jgi:hypothetical protein
MPQIRKWSEEEIALLNAGKQKNGPSRKEIEETYDQLLSDLSAGDFATLTLDDGENKPTIRNRLKGAATRRNLTIAFRRTKDDTIVFHLKEPE